MGVGLRAASGQACCWRCFVTSAVAITAFAEGSLASASTRSFASIAGTPLNNSHAVAVAGLCMAGLEALALFTAWTAFVRATRNLVTAYA